MCFTDEDFLPDIIIMKNWTVFIEAKSKNQRFERSHNKKTGTVPSRYQITGPTNNQRNLNDCSICSFHALQFLFSGRPVAVFLKQWFMWRGEKSPNQDFQLSIAYSSLTTARKIRCMNLRESKWSSQMCNDLYVITQENKTSNEQITGYTCLYFRVPFIGTQSTELKRTRWSASFGQGKT